MGRRELILRLSQRTGRPSSTVAEVLDAVFDEIATQTLSGESVKVIGFGSFSLHRRSRSERRNPRTGEPMVTPERDYPVFIPSRRYRARAAEGV